MKINKSDIEHLASLSALSLSDEEMEGYAKDLEEILTFVDKINSLETENLAEATVALDSVNVFRKDEVKESFDRELLMQNAPSSNGIAYQLPPILE